MRRPCVSSSVIVVCVGISLHDFHDDIPDDIPNDTCGRE